MNGSRMSESVADERPVREKKGDRTPKDPGRFEDVLLYVMTMSVLIGIAWHFSHANRQLERNLLDPATVSSFIHPDSSRSATYYQLQTRVAGLRYRQAAYGLYGQETRRNAGFLVGSRRNMWFGKKWKLKRTLAGIGLSLR